jgi:protoporphyrinogen IX oxidase
MLWIKALHIVFIASWFAGLFYLPRIFVNLAMEDKPVVTERLLLMARKLYRFTTLLSMPAVVLGVWLMFGYGLGAGDAEHRVAGWMWAKLLIVALTLAYHIRCGKLLKQFERGECKLSHRWFRWWNEIPVFLLLGAVILVVVRPF